MKSYKLAFAATALSLALIAAGPAKAAPIDYIFSGTFDGSLGTTTYTGQSFTISLTGDTANVTSGGGEFANVATGATFTIGASAGSLTGSFNEVVLNPSFGSGVGAVIFGQGQSTPPSFVGEGLSSAPLATYDLTTALALTSGTVTQTPGSTYTTSLGDLVFGNISALSFEADLVPTPLPAALPLFAAALGTMGFLGWSRKRKAPVSFRG